MRILWVSACVLSLFVAIVYRVDFCNIKCSDNHICHIRTSHYYETMKKYTCFASELEAKTTDERNRPAKTN